jgi:hypothetical protein
LHYRYRETSYDITFNAFGSRRTVKSIRCDGKESSDKTLGLEDDGKVHKVEVELE